MEEQEYFNLSLAEAARQFDIGEDDLRSLILRGALEGRFRDGQWWVRLGPRRGEETAVHLWHGTSKDRTEIIVEHGFSPETQGKQVWFTTSEVGARIHAIGRARRRRRTPMLLGCAIDLERYPIFWKRSPQVYVFHQPLGPEVIRSVQEVDEREESRRYRMGMRRRARGTSIAVGITRNSGPLGILLWINTYLDRCGLESITEENPVVRDVFAWVAREYREGRDGPIAEEELIARAAPLLQSGENTSFTLL